MAKANKQNNEVLTVDAEEVFPEEKISAHINEQLVKANVTESIITNLQEKYLPLKLKGLDDKEGYLEIVDARKDCKQWRILTGKVCKQGREAAVLEQKLWIKKEKDVSDRISKVESYLEDQENAYETEQNRIKTEKKQAQDKAFALRNTELTGMGAFFNGTEYVSEAVSYELSMIRESDEETYQNFILPKFKAVFTAKEEIRIAAEKKKQDEADELKKQQDLLKQQQDELAQQQFKIKEQQDKIDAENKQREDDRQKKIADERTALQSKRLNELLPFNPYGADIDMATLWAVDEFTYNKVLEEKKSAFEKKQAADKLFQEQEDAKRQAQAKIDEDARIKAATEKALADEKERQRIAAEKEKSDKQAADLKKQQELDGASDKVKWDAFVSEITKITIPQFKSKSYKERAGFVSDFFDGLK